MCERSRQRNHRDSPREKRRSHSSRASSSSRRASSKRDNADNYERYNGPPPVVTEPGDSDVDEELDISHENDGRGNGENQVPDPYFGEDIEQEFGSFNVMKDVFRGIGGSLFGSRGARIGGILGDFGSTIARRMHNHHHHHGDVGGRRRGFYSVSSVQRKYRDGELESEIAMYDVNGRGETRMMKKDFETGEQKVVYKKHGHDREGEGRTVENVRGERGETRRIESEERGRRRKSSKRNGRGSSERRRERRRER